MLKYSGIFRRGYKVPYQMYPSERPSIQQLGGEPRVRRLHDCFYEDTPPQPPLRVQYVHTAYPPVLFNRQEHLASLDAALAPHRVPNQLRDTIKQLEIGVRNAEEYIQKHLLPAQYRPTSLQLWSTVMEQRKGHVFAALPTHHMVPVVSMLLADFTEGKMTLPEAEETYRIMLSLTSSHDAAVKREIGNVMVRVYTLAGEYDKAMAVIRSMKARKVRRNFVTYAPLYRVARINENVEMHLQLGKLVHDVEGGSVGKFLRIDIPRMWGLLLVPVRYSWAFIHSCLLLLASCLIHATAWWFGFI